MTVNKVLITLALGLMIAACTQQQADPGVTQTVVNADWKPLTANTIEFTAASDPSGNTTYRLYDAEAGVYCYRLASTTWNCAASAAKVVATVEDATTTEATEESK